MNWFCWQRGLGGERIPVAFDEHPRETPSMSRDLIWETLRKIPAELQNASLVELVAWAEGAA